eukprot:365596-Chlamydomonas_euryale.AAC.18
MQLASGLLLAFHRSLITNGDGIQRMRTTIAPRHQPYVHMVKRWMTESNCMALLRQMAPHSGMILCFSPHKIIINAVQRGFLLLVVRASAQGHFVALWRPGAPAPSAARIPGATCNFLHCQEALRQEAVRAVKAFSML